MTKNQIRVTRIRLKMFSIAGEYCCKCRRYEGDYKMLELHHINPKDKLFSISATKAKCMGSDAVINEVKKCLPLCPNCHREYHLGYWKYSELDINDLQDYQVKLIKEYDRG